MKTEETISATATAIGTAGIGVIRMSGENSIDIAEKIFDKDLKSARDRSLIFGHVKNFAGEIIDEAIILIMRAPKSYTKENVVEIQCHGGAEVLRQVLSATFEAGARPAERGEFTKRAFLNGRLDLTQAQAVLDIIQAKTSTALSVAQNQLSGKTSKKIRAIRTEILDVLAHIEALIDFPEDDIDEIFISDIDKKIVAQIDEIKIFLDNQKSGRILREGLETAIIGKPNVGKSSLLNFLAETERAIVTDIPGTTRDSIEEFVNIGGVPLKIIDTAGIRNSDNPVEKIGIERARDCASRAELILALFDGSRELSAEDFEILKIIEGRNAIILITKADLPQVIDVTKFEKFIPISVKKNLGVEKFLAAISEKVGNVNAEMNFVRDEREADLLRRAVKNLEEARLTLQKNIGVDFISIDLRAALELLSELTGESVTEDVIEEIFSKFCIGK
ncbi:MAG: tRNA uridine-5-carboxymethylaminomethyl(34) synthesis GTPase MnmE [Selenomonadaceae bacterium]|nr:tRNA uridine-5-carboxymethylaminomethyl(34) synthesis GTPase MnmE [Selenomonadaceae bacterium]